MNSIPAVNQDAAFRREREADEALLRQALEALHETTGCVDGYYIPRGKTMLASTEAAIAALRARLGETT